MDLFRGGRETSTAQIAAELARRGCDVTILCQQGSWRHEGVEVVPLGRRGLTRAGRLRNFVDDVHRQLGQTHYDVGHAMLPIPAADVVQFRGGTIAGQRLASRRRKGPIGSALAGLFAPLNARRATMAMLERQLIADESVALLPVSDMVAQELAEHYGRTENLRVVYNAVADPVADAEQVAQWRRQGRIRVGLESEGILFLTLATNFALKGVAETIRAFARWRGTVGRKVPGRLVVVGRTPERAEGYSRLAGAHGVAREVVFEDWTDRVEQVYAAADVCVLLSWYDPCSRVVLEATRRGIPSITTAWNGAGEILGDGGGMVVPSPRHLADVAEAMVELTDAEKRRRAADRCLAMSDQLSMSRHADELMAIYQEVSGC